jgi:predicted metal-dependent phosphoesterase TrpH
MILTKGRISASVFDVIDLHTHSTASDGDHSPTELVARGIGIGLKAIALTDHDTVSGLEEGERATAGSALRFIPGIELEAAFTPGELHILGLNLRNWKGWFAEQIRILQEKRHNRNLSILDQMNQSGIQAHYEDISRYASGLVGRPHFARYLLERGIVESVQEAFDRFLGKGKPFYIPKETLLLEDIITLIHRGGGKAIVAHPLSLRLTIVEIGELMPAWCEMGIDGIEAYHSKAKRNRRGKLEERREETGSS